MKIEKQFSRTAPCPQLLEKIGSTGLNFVADHIGIETIATPPQPRPRSMSLGRSFRMREPRFLDALSPQNSWRIPGCVVSSVSCQSLTYDLQPLVGGMMSEEWYR